MKRILGLLLIMTIILSTVGCGAKEASVGATVETPEVTQEAKSSTVQTEKERTTGAEEQLHFVYVSPLLAHPVWLISKEGFEQACNELGVQGDWVGPQNISPEEMSKLVETAVAQKADGIITQGLVPAEPVKTAISAGIPVLVVDSDIQDAERLAFFGKDVMKQAEVLYEATLKKINSDTPINASIQVAALNYQIAHDQIEAIKEVFGKHPGGFEVANISESKSDKMKSTTEWENTFKAYPEINVAINLAAEAGPACAKVVQDKGIRDKVMVFGVDDTEETLDLIRKGELDGTVATSFYNYGYQAAYWLYQNVTEGKTPEKVINDAGTIIVTNENIDTYGEALKVKVDLQ